MFSKLPNEIIYNISNLVAHDSTLCLKPLVLVNRQWHGVAVPLLLATISVSSLGQVVDLCSQIISSHRHEDNHVSSRIAKYTKTIVISGIKWKHGMPDCHLGLEQPKDQYGQESEDDGPPSTVAAAEPDTNMLPKDISEIIRSAFPHLVLLDGFEWYGRFAGDYYLVKYLQRANVIRHLTYGIEYHVSSSSPAYYNNAFLFTGLESVAVTFELKSRPALLDRVFQMMRRNPELQSILLDWGRTASSTGWRLVDLICNPSPSSTNKSIAVWPNLQHLTLRSCQDSLWESAQEVDQLERFLIAHPKLETLRFQERCAPPCRIIESRPLSLASHPDALPCLKKLLGSQRLIAGVLESRAACLSVQTVMSTDDTDDGWIHCERRANYNAPFVERIICALEKAPENQIQRLSQVVSQLSCSLFARLARFAPNVRFLEFIEIGAVRWETQNDDFCAETDIPAGLNKFMNLETISFDIAEAFVRPFDCKRSGLLELARQVPRLRSIHCQDGLLVTYVRGPGGQLDIRVGGNRLNNEDYDWIPGPGSVDWVHRPRSYHATQEAWMADLMISEAELSRFF